MKRLKMFLGVAILAILAPMAEAAVPQLINFQGVLRNPDGTPVTDSTYMLTFRIWDSETNGNVIWVSVSTPVPTSKGLFNTVLLAPELAFTSDQRWLGVTVETDPPEPELSPRVQLGSVGYAYRVGSVDGATGGDIFGDLRLHSTLTVGDLSGNTGRVEVTDGASNTVVADGATGDLTAKGKASIGPGHTNTGAFAFVSGQSNTTSGDFSTIGGGNSNTVNSLYGTIGGGVTNFVGAERATIGGGADNNATQTYSTIGGGQGNVASGDHAFVGGGHNNQAANIYATVGGGRLNVASGLNATVSGGVGDTASELAATVGGGHGNMAGGANATIAGGAFNLAGISGGGEGTTIGGGTSDTAVGGYSTVPGGRKNKAFGWYSLAAGFQAKAIHDGSFVWADRGPGGTGADFASTATDQFLIRAMGGVGIGTTAPSSMLHVREDRDGNSVLTIDNQSVGTGSGQGIYLNSEDGIGTGGTFILAFDNSHGSAPATMRIGNNVSGGKIDFVTGAQVRLTITNAGNVGIGTTTPGALLHVNGTAGNGTGVWSTVSDKRLKKDIEPIEKALETVERLQGVTFHWKDAEKDAQFGRVRGLIAQDVEKVIPEWIKTDPDGYKRLEPIGIDALLIEAIKEQQRQIEGLRDKIQQLEKRASRATVE